MTQLFTLWFRPDKRRPWEAVFAGRTSQECTDAMGTLGRRNGEWYTCAGTAPPRKLNLTAPRAARA